MLGFIRGVRSLISVLLVGLLFALGSLVLRPFVLPAAWLWPRHRQLLVTWFMKGMSGGILACLRVGGARARRRGVLSTTSPVLVLANHQALLDICQVTLLAQPRVPAFVARRRYARFVPLISASLRLLGSPIVDPKKDPRAAVDAVRRGALELPHGLVLFPEGHRSRDGEVRPFRNAGVIAALTARPMPVYLVVNEGVWRVRRFVDLLFRVHLVDAYSEVMGPLAPPEDPDEIPAFVEDCRKRIAARLREIRAEHA